jgi:hypothetical protein
MKVAAAASRSLVRMIGTSFQVEIDGSDLCG